MPSFQKAFQDSKGKPIKYKDLELHGIDRIPVKKSFSGCLRLVSTNSEWKQGVSMSIQGTLTINGYTGEDFIIWADDIKDGVLFKGNSEDLQLMVWNAWDIGVGRTDAWMNGAAMIIEVEGNKRRYRCNDAHPDENFDDIVFEIVIDK